LVCTSQRQTNTEQRNHIETLQKTFQKGQDEFQPLYLRRIHYRGQSRNSKKEGNQVGWRRKRERGNKGKENGRGYWLIEGRMKERWRGRRKGKKSRT
jgi:hypothetical protein